MSQRENGRTVPHDDPRSAIDVGRRAFMVRSAMAGGAVTILPSCGGGGGGGGTSGPTPSPSPTPTPSPSPSPVATEFDLANIALTHLYLSDSFLTVAYNGRVGVPATLSTGVGVQGTATGGREVTAWPRAEAYRPRAIGPTLYKYNTVEVLAGQLAQLEHGFLVQLRNGFTQPAVAMPEINIGGGADGAFTTMARLAGIVGANETFDPYASPENYLLSAYYLLDAGVSVSAYAAARATTPDLADRLRRYAVLEAYSAGTVRTRLLLAGRTNRDLLTKATALSALRDRLAKTTAAETGVANIALSSATIVPSNPSGFIGERSPEQFLSIMYLGNNVSAGGFFPRGVNGTIRTSVA